MKHMAVDWAGSTKCCMGISLVQSAGLARLTLLGTLKHIQLADRAV
jgi:hypothetical protein